MNFFAYSISRESLLQSVEEKGAFIETVPVFINVRDRLSCLKLLLEWLEAAGHKNIILIDNASTYPPLVQFLNATRYRTVRLRHNLGHTALWRIRELSSIIRTEWFVYTDPDVVPTESCPSNVVAYLFNLLQQFPDYLKAGLGLRLGDIPEHFHLKESVLGWEKNLYGKEIAPNVFQADVDTTFALHRPKTPYVPGPSMRLCGIYEARHLPWYVDSTRLDEEEEYYRSHIRRGVNTWNRNKALKQTVPPGPGGLAARMDERPLAVLETLLHSRTGRLMRGLEMLGHLSGRPPKRWRGDSGVPSHQVRQEILEVLTSEEWLAAWRISEPVRRMQAVFR